MQDRIKRLLAAVVIGLVGGPTIVFSEEQHPETEGLLQIDVLVDMRDTRQARNQLLGLYLTINDYGTLPTQQVDVAPGQDLISRMVELGEWPAALGGSEIVMASLLCDLNPGDCKRPLAEASDAYQGFVVNGFQPSQPSWAQLNDSGLLTIPRLGLTNGYYPRSVKSTVIESLRASGYDGLPVETTSNFLQVYCGFSDCSETNDAPMTWNLDSPTAVLFKPLPVGQLQAQNDLGLIAKTTGISTDKLTQFLSDQSSFSVMAVPAMMGQFNLDISVAEWNSGAADIVQDRVGGIATLSNDSLQLEGSHSDAAETNEKYIGSVWNWMRDVDEDLKAKLKTLNLAVTEGRMPGKASNDFDGQIVIMHVDAWADLNHCHFALASHYIDFALLDFDLQWGRGGNVPLKYAEYSPERVSECRTQLEAGKFVQKVHPKENYGNDQHGTGTLSALVGALSYLEVLSSNNFVYAEHQKPWLIIHVPTKAKRPKGIFQAVSYTVEERQRSNEDLGVKGADRVEIFFEHLHKSFRSFPPPNLINFSMSLRGALQANLNGYLETFDEEGLNPLIIAAAAKPVEGDSLTPQATCERFPVSAGHDNVASVVGVFWTDTSLSLIDQGTDSRSCHTVASLGKIPTPFPENLSFRYAQGSSYAAPILTATVAHLMRNGAANGKFPKDLGLSDKHVEEIIRWILATSTFGLYENQYSKGGNADIPSIIDYRRGIIEAEGGCRISGFDSHIIHNGSQRDNSWPLKCSLNRKQEYPNNKRVEAIYRVNEKQLWVLLPDKDDVCDGKAINFILMEELSKNAFAQRALHVRRETYNLPRCELYFNTSKDQYEIPLDKIHRIVNPN